MDYQMMVNLALNVHHHANLNVITQELTLATNQLQNVLLLIKMAYVYKVAQMDHIRT